MRETFTKAVDDLQKIVGKKRPQMQTVIPLLAQVFEGRSRPLKRISSKFDVARPEAVPLEAVEGPVVMQVRLAWPTAAEAAQPLETMKMSEIAKRMNLC